MDVQFVRPFYFSTNNYPTCKQYIHDYSLQNKEFH